MSSQNRKFFAKTLLSPSGQAVVEYVLLMVITITLAVFIVKQLASRTQGEEGLVVKKWHAILQVIGTDNPEDPNN